MKAYILARKLRFDGIFSTVQILKMNCIYVTLLEGLQGYEGSLQSFFAKSSMARSEYSQKNCHSEQKIAEVAGNKNHQKCLIVTKMTSF